MNSDQLRSEAQSLLTRVLEASKNSPRLASEEATRSAANLLAYRELRREDISALQMELADSGLSSLGRMEGHVVNSLEKVVGWLGAGIGDGNAPSRMDANDILRGRSTKLFGRPRKKRDTRIMVTLDHLEPDPVGYLAGMLLAGMDVVRINGAHGTAADWHRLNDALLEAEHSLGSRNPLGRRCHVYVDLCGPRIRTGPMHAEIRLKAGSRLRISRRTDANQSKSEDDNLPEISCTVPEALEPLRVGHRVFFDDGKFGGEVVECSSEWLEVLITTPIDRAKRLKAEKGINFPDTALALPALTDQDRLDLAEVVGFADVVGLSFVHSSDDIRLLHDELARLGKPETGVVAKIETRAGARNLTGILLAGLELPAFGVMIARGDLAVEVGFDDLASFQENILCLCEAAHVPTIWATQVLETLARNGLPARAEITDAAASKRADCVMLNKGPHVTSAVRMLDRLLTSEQRHREKKRDLFREFMSQAPG